MNIESKLETCNSCRQLTKEQYIRHLMEKHKISFFEANDIAERLKLK